MLMYVLFYNAFFSGLFLLFIYFWYGSMIKKYGVSKDFEKPYLFLSIMACLGSVFFLASLTILWFQGLK